jgi:hypothetical protein
MASRVTASAFRRPSAGRIQSRSPCILPACEAPGGQRFLLQALDELGDGRGRPLLLTIAERVAAGINLAA